MIFVVAAALTVVIESAVLGLAGHRGRVFFAAVGLVNVATNLSLNLTLALAPAGRTPLLATLEPAVVVVEWWVLSRFSERARGRLLGDVFVANLVSFACGFLL